MSQPTLLKVYASLERAPFELFEEAKKICQQACPAENARASMDGNTLLISFEGIWFPHDEILEMIERRLTPDQKGKMDILDLEEWKMTRYVFQDGGIKEKASPLNNVLDYSGH